MIARYAAIGVKVFTNTAVMNWTSMYKVVTINLCG